MKKCSIVGCDSLVHGWGYCNKHYRKLKKYGDPLKGWEREGQTRHPLYSTWWNMRRRCYDQKNNSYPHYGGRGIKVCKRWLKFSNFLLDMGNKPSKDHSIDRINNNENYEPNNCKWSTRKEQNWNKRSNVPIIQCICGKPVKQRSSGHGSIRKYCSQKCYHISRTTSK